MTNDKINRLCAGKTVLHIGCAGYWQQFLKTKDCSVWDFHKLTHIAKSVKGIDIDKEGVDYFKKQGYDVEYGDAEKFDFGKTFEVIYATDLIEHLSNPGNFLDRAKAHMNKKSILVLTTPNPYSLGMTIRGLIGKTCGGVYKDHTAFFHEKNLKELCRRYQLEIVELEYYTRYDGWKTVVTKLASLINKQFNQKMLLILKLKLATE